MFALQKSFLNEIFEKYPEIAKVIKKQSTQKYHKIIKRPLHQQRRKVIDDLNKNNSYRIIKIEEKHLPYYSSEDEKSSEKAEKSLENLSIPELQALLHHKINRLHSALN